jgi:hypothetical protein
MAEISAEAVKGALARLRQATLPEICGVLGLAKADWKGRDRVHKILRDLQRSGQVGVMPGDPVYFRSRPGGEGGVQGKLWRAVILKARKGDAWSYVDLARLAGCSYDYAKKYAEFLERQELVRPAGKAVQGNRLYFRLAPGLEGNAAPHWHRRAEKRRKASDQ